MPCSSITSRVLLHVRSVICCSYTALPTPSRSCDRTLSASWVIMIVRCWDDACLLWGCHPSLTQAECFAEVLLCHVKRRLNCSDRATLCPAVQRQSSMEALFCIRPTERAQLLLGPLEQIRGKVQLGCARAGTLNSSSRVLACSWWAPSEYEGPAKSRLGGSSASLSGTPLSVQPLPC